MYNKCVHACACAGAFIHLCMDARATEVNMRYLPLLLFGKGSLSEPVVHSYSYNVCPVSPTSQACDATAGFYIGRCCRSTLDFSHLHSKCLTH